MAIDLVIARFSSRSRVLTCVRVATQKYQISLQALGAVKQKKYL